MAKKPDGERGLSTQMWTWGAAWNINSRGEEEDKIPRLMRVYDEADVGNEHRHERALLLPVVERARALHAQLDHHIKSYTVGGSAMPSLLAKQCDRLS